jgi:predicted DNA-binding transcriptional regulator AlpA
MAQDLTELSYFLTTRELCEMFKITPRWLHLRLKAKRGPPVYRFGNRYRYRKHEVLAWLDTIRT